MKIRKRKKAKLMKSHALVGRRVALLVGVENYHDIDGVQYAEADARGLFGVLCELGFDVKRDVRLLLSDRATKTTILSALRRMTENLNSEDQFIFSFSGHGFSTPAGQSFLMPADAQEEDHLRTSIGIADIFGTLKRSEANQKLLFLDACHLGIAPDPSARSPYSGLSRDELESTLSESRHCVAFASCLPTERSFTDSKLGHGVWTYHLLEALRGEAPSALAKGSLLTASGLQAYLRAEVPDAARALGKGRIQTPQCFGYHTEGDVLIADVAELIARRAPKIDEADTVLRAELRAVQDWGRVKNLSGFSRWNREPKGHSSAEQSFVAERGAAEVEEDLRERYEEIRNGLSYKSSEIHLSTDFGCIETPAFIYHASVRQSDDDPRYAVIERRVADISRAEVVLGEGFQDIFRDVFTEIEFEAPGPIDVPALLDLVEGEDCPPDVHLLSVEPDRSSCELSLDGFAGTLRVTVGSLAIISRATRRTPIELARSLHQGRGRLTSMRISGLLGE